MVVFELICLSRAPEVDILSEGKLDFSEEILNQLDYVARRNS